MLDIPLVPEKSLKAIFIIFTLQHILYYIKLNNKNGVAN